MKAILKLFPRSPHVRAVLEAGAANPFLEIRYLENRPISYVIIFLQKKWAAIIGQEKIRLLPRRRDFSTIDHPGWSDRSLDSAASIMEAHPHERTGPGRVFALDYTWEPAPAPSTQQVSFSGRLPSIKDIQSRTDPYLWRQASLGAPPAVLSNMAEPVDDDDDDDEVGVLDSTSGIAAPSLSLPPLSIQLEPKSPPPKRLQGRQQFHHQPQSRTTQKKSVTIEEPVNGTASSGSGPGGTDMNSRKRKRKFGETTELGGVSGLGVGESEAPSAKRRKIGSPSGSGGSGTTGVPAVLAVSVGAQ